MLFHVAFLSMLRFFVSWIGMWLLISQWYSEVMWLNLPIKCPNMLSMHHQRAGFSTMVWVSTQVYTNLCICRYSSFSSYIYIYIPWASKDVIYTCSGQRLLFAYQGMLISSWPWSALASLRHAWVGAWQCWLWLGNNYGTKKWGRMKLKRNWSLMVLDACQQNLFLWETDFNPCFGNQMWYIHWFLVKHLHRPWWFYAGCLGGWIKIGRVEPRCHPPPCQRMPLTIQWVLHFNIARRSKPFLVANVETLKTS